MTLWKMLSGTVEEPESDYDKSRWVVGEWRDASAEWRKEWGWSTPPSVETCEFGFHASPTLVEAFMFVEPGVIAQVEVDGDSDEDDDGYGDCLPTRKSAHERMRLVKLYAWDQDDYRALAEEMGRYEQEHGCGSRYHTLPSLLSQYQNSGSGYRWQMIVSLMLDRRQDQAEWDHINQWWQEYLEKRES